MDTLYKIMEIVMPFDFMNYEFMKNALLATIVVSPLFAILGTMAVNNKMAFFSDALGHSALTGIAIRKFIRHKQLKFRNNNICNWICTTSKLC